MADTQKAPTKAPTQTSAVTGKGAQKETAPTFSQSPGLAPKPADNGATKVQPDGPPARKGPATAAQALGGQGQQPAKN